MTQQTILLKKTPKIEFQLLDDGFQLINVETKKQSGFYTYSDVQSVKLNKIWFARWAKYLRVITWILNGVPYFPDAASYKKSNIIIHVQDMKIGIWLTNAYMTKQAKSLKGALDNKIIDK